MKRITFVLAALLWLLTNNPAQACDGGCPILSGYFDGILPQYHKHFVGLRWRFSHFRSEGGHAGFNLAAETREYFHSFELYGRYLPHRRVQLMAFVPLNYNIMASPDVSYSAVGLGDISLMAYYNIYNSNFLDSVSSNVQHSILLGGGVKAPTGKFNKEDTDGVLMSPDFQLGTGSVDFLLSAVYTLRHKSFGMNTNVTYKINLPNANGYKIGNQLNATLMAFYFHQMGYWRIMPNIGMQFEHSELNYNKEFARINTGGMQALATVGFDIYFRQMRLSLNYHQPVWQNLANGHLESGPRAMASFNYFF